MPIALVSYVVYSIPVYFLAGLQPFVVDNGYTLAVYVAMCVLYCYAMRLTAWCFAHAFQSKHAALISLGRHVIWLLLKVL